MKSIIVFLLLFFSLQISSQSYIAESPLEPNKFETPRETYSVFLKAMNDYKRGLESKNSQLTAELDTAVRCLNLDGIPYGLRIEKGRNAAILLKEVMDRVAIIDPMTIPEVSDKPELPLTRWVLEKTEIAISKVEGGERANEFLFSRDTVYRALEFYTVSQKVKLIGKKKFLPSAINLFRISLLSDFGISV